jgi:hypothetical protein
MDTWGREVGAALLADGGSGAVGRVGERVAIEFMLDLAGIGALTPVRIETDGPEAIGIRER